MPEVFGMQLHLSGATGLSNVIFGVLIEARSALPNERIESSLLIQLPNHFKT